MNTLKVVADIGKNRLYFNISGSVTKRELEQLYTETRFCVADLQAGFDVVTDFSQCRLVSISGVPTFRKIMNYLIANKVGEVVRIVDKNSLLYTQVVNITMRIQGYKPIIVSSAEEAEKRLEGSIKRNGLRFILHRPSIQYSREGRSWKGEIINISTSGCAVEAVKNQPVEGEEILLAFNLDNQDMSMSGFETKARVVRVENDNFAVEFLSLDSLQSDQLWKCLVAESQKEIANNRY